MEEIDLRAGKQTGLRLILYADPECAKMEEGREGIWKEIEEVMEWLGNLKMESSCFGTVGRQQRIYSRRLQPRLRRQAL
jgi:hypothetical protein